MQQYVGSSSDDHLEPPIEGNRSTATEDRSRTDLSASIRGWGSDLALERRPGVPRDRAPELGAELLYPPIEPQTPMFKIHKSTEHGRLTPVFGTACPARGLSGLLRDSAYKLSEGRLARWMLLLMADRVDVLESLAVDLARGHVPDLAKETGLRSELTYNRPAVQRKAILTGAVFVGVLALALLARSRRTD